MRPPEDKNPEQISVRIKETKQTEELAFLVLVLKGRGFSIMSIKGGGTEITCHDEQAGDTREKVVKALREQGYTVIEE